MNRNVLPVDTDSGRLDPRVSFATGATARFLRACVRVRVLTVGGSLQP